MINALDPKQAGNANPPMPPPDEPEITDSSVEEASETPETPVEGIEGNGTEERTGKIAPERAGYRVSGACGTCLHFLAPSSCDLVSGPIAVDWTCNFHEENEDLDVEGEGEEGLGGSEENEGTMGETDAGIEGVLPMDDGATAGGSGEAFAGGGSSIGGGVGPVKNTAGPESGGVNIEDILGGGAGAASRKPKGIFG